MFQGTGLSPLGVVSAWVGWQELLVHPSHIPHNIENNDPTSCQETTVPPGSQFLVWSVKSRGAGPALMFQKFLPQGWELRRRCEVKGPQCVNHAQWERWRLWCGPVIRGKHWITQSWAIFFLMVFSCFTTRSWKHVASLWPVWLKFSSVQFSSVTQSCPTLRSYEPQYARPPCPSPTPGVHPNPWPLYHQESPVSPILSFRGFIVLCFILRSLDHFKLILMRGGIRSVSSFSLFFFFFLYVDIQLFCHLLKKRPLLHCIPFAPLSK